MKSMLTSGLAVAVLTLALSAPAAVAQIDVDLAFDPDTASAGDVVSLFVSIANFGDEAVVADLELTISFGELSIGPISGALPLGAGQELSAELAFVVPPVPVSGALTISVTASAGDFSDSASATLSLTGAAGAPAPPLSGIADGLMQELTGGSQVPTRELSVGALKSQYR